LTKKLLYFSYNHPRLILLLLIAMTLSVTPLLSRLQFDISAQSMVVKSDEHWDVYQKSLREFGSDSTIIVVLSDEHLFSPENLSLIKTSVNQLKRLDFITNTSSLYNVPNVKDNDGYVETRPFLQKIPEDENASQTLIDDALANAMVADNLVSRDRQTMAIYLYYNGDEHYTGRDREIAGAIEQALDPLKQHLETVFQLGSPYVRDVISRQIQIDQETILPAALGVLLLVLAFSMGRFNCAVVPLSSGTISIIVTLAFMAYMEIPVNVLTSIIPALLIIIGSTEDVHLMAEYHTGIREGQTRDEAVKRLPVNQSLAILLAFITTFIGFMSITINDLEMLRQFGWLVAFGLFVNFVVTTLFVPAYLRLFGGYAIGEVKRLNSFQRIANFIFSVVIRFKKTTLFLFLVASGYFLLGTQHLVVNNNTLSYFDEKSDIRQRANTISDHLSGMQTFSVILDSSIEGTFKKVRYLEEVEKIQRYIDGLKVFDKTLSFADFIKLTNQVMEGTNHPQLPLEDDVVQVYMEFVQPEAVSSYVNQDYSSTRILVRHHISESSALKKEIEAIRNYIEHDLKSSMKLSITGDSVLDIHSADVMALGQIQSIALMVGVILLLVSMLFVNFRAGLIALLPNIFPIIVLFGIMGYYNIPLDTGTTMVAAIALGISVDDTIHFLSRYHLFTRGESNVELALRKTILHEATPITTTSIALALGFSTLMFSSFQPVKYFGGLSAMVMVLSMFSTLVLTPVLLSFTKLITVWDMLSLNLKDDVLRNSEIFRGLKSFQIKQAILSGTIKEFNRGDVIIDQGVIGEELYVMLEGTATATHREEDGSIHTLGYLKAGDLFGEVAELSQRTRMARVTAEEKMKVLEIKWEDIRQLGRFHPRIAMRLFQNLSRVMGKRVVEITEDKEKVHDELTGALTKPYLCEMLRHEIKRRRYFDEALSMMLIDIEILSPEHELTQSQVDEYVRAITEIINRHIQDVDIFARWDKCSFMLLLPQATEAQALALADKIEDSIEKSDFSNQVYLSINAAVTQVNTSEDNKQVINRLEAQLFSAKQARKSLRISVA
jgi:hypothetical protein